MNPSEETTDPKDSPQLSIIVASLQPVGEVSNFLDALCPQRRGKEVEIIVSHGCANGRMEGLKEKHPEIILVRPSGKTTLPNLWGKGIACSTGEIIALTESACIPDKRWVQAVLEAHESPHPVIGGAVEAAGLLHWVDWAAYFCEYGQFMLPLREGAANELPGNNVSFKRWALEKGQEFVQNGFWKTYWCRKLQEEGIDLMAWPSIVVSCHKSYRLVPFLVRRFHHGRCFAGMRMARASLISRITYTLGSAILPFLFTVRIFRAVLPKKRYRKEFIFSLPISILAVLLWSIGEFWGYLAGTGNSCAHIY